VEGEDEVEVVVPDHELVVSSGDVRNLEAAVGIRPPGVDAPERRVVESDPWGGVAERAPLWKRGGGARDGVDDLALDGGGPVSAAASANAARRIDVIPGPELSKIGGSSPS
jgi:hypothetical protein